MSTYREYLEDELASEYGIDLTFISVIRPMGETMTEEQKAEWRKNHPVKHKEKPETPIKEIL